MEVMIQNNTETPFVFHYPHNTVSGKGMSSIQIDAKEIKSIDEELFNKVILTSGFFIQKRNEGKLKVISGSNVDKSVKEARINEDALYSGYVEVMSKVKAAGGLRNAEIQKFLDGDGMPKLELLRPYMGDSANEVLVRNFKTRYNNECRAGMHDEALTLPGGEIVTPSKDGFHEEKDLNSEEAKKLYTENELIALGLDEVKRIADKKGVQYRTNATIEAIAKKVVESQAQ